MLLTVTPYLLAISSSGVLPRNASRVDSSKSRRSRSGNRSRRRPRLLRKRAAHAAALSNGRNRYNFCCRPIRARWKTGSINTSPRARSAYREALQAVSVEGGVAGNVVPDSVTLRVHHRYAPDRSPDEAEAWVRALLDDHVEVDDELIQERGRERFLLERQLGRRGRGGVVVFPAEPPHEEPRRLIALGSPRRFVPRCRHNKLLGDKSMNNAAKIFLLTGVVALIVGMLWGIQMSASGDHTLSPAHGHLNLIGFVTMAVFGGYYALTPQAATGRLAKAHFGVTLAAVLLIVPGIVIAVIGYAEPASIARTFASEERTPWNSSRELVGQGVANVAAAVSGSFPVGGPRQSARADRRAAWSSRLFSTMSCSPE